MGESKLKIKDYLWIIPMIVGVSILCILWTPVVIYKSIVHSKSERKVENNNGE